MLHDIAGDQSARATQARLAVNGQCAITLLGYVDEFAYDGVAWRAAVRKEEVTVLETGIDKALGVVDLLVEADNAFHVVLAEVGQVGFGRVQRVAVFDFAFGVRPAKGEEFAGQDPVKIAVFDFLLHKKKTFTFLNNFWF